MIHDLAGNVWVQTAVGTVIFVGLIWAGFVALIRFVLAPGETAEQRRAAGREFARDLLRELGRAAPEHRDGDGCDGWARPTDRTPALASGDSRDDGGGEGRAFHGLNHAHRGSPVWDPPGGETREAARAIADDEAAREHHLGDAEAFLEALRDDTGDPDIGPAPEMASAPRMARPYAPQATAYTPVAGHRTDWTHPPGCACQHPALLARRVDGFGGDQLAQLAAEAAEGVAAGHTSPIFRQLLGEFGGAVARGQWPAPATQETRIDPGQPLQDEPHWTTPEDLAGWREKLLNGPMPWEETQPQGASA